MFAFENGKRNKALGFSMRIVSLLPSATEIVGILGQLDNLVGVSHECDFPPEVNDKPRVTKCQIHGTDLPSAGIDRLVTETLSSTGTLYSLDEGLIRQLKPDIILTQRLCDVCAVGYDSVAAFAATLPGPPQVVNLEPSSLAEIFENIRSVARMLGKPDRGDTEVSVLVERVEAVRARLSSASHRPKCFLMEWIDPPFCSGHWGPELVQLAGGIDPIGISGKPSSRIPWEKVLDAQPEVIVLACCGCSPQRILDDLPTLQQYSGWDTLPAVRQGRVYVVDGSAYFSRPGPRIVDSLEILAEIIHPVLFSGRFPDRGVLRLEMAKGVLKVTPKEALPSRGIDEKGRY
jgi:iron complex transport system substrate-binding protein